MRDYIGQTLRSEYALTDNQIMRVAPSIFAERKHESRSKMYTFIPTIEIIEVLRKEGFFPFCVTQSRSRFPGKTEFSKHMIRLRKKNCMNNLKINLELGEIILINSHDGTTSYQMMAGIYRLACTNGLIVGDNYESYKINHKGNIKDNIIEAAYKVVSELELIKNNMNEMKGINLNPLEKEIFAESALMLKYEESEFPIESRALLSRRRFEDNKNDLWTTFNMVQENIIKGGIKGHSKSGKKTKTREVKSIDNNIKLNKALWNLASKMAELKS
jgi:hypothetical protein